MFQASKLSLLLTATLLLSDSVQALWPLPRNLQTGHQTVLLAQDFKITVSREPSLDLWAAIAKTEEYLKNDKLQRLVLGRGASDAPTFETASKLHTLTLSLGENSNNISTEAKLPLGTRDEAYTLWIPADGSAAHLSANSSLGLFRWLTTFSQLWYVYEESTYVLDCPIFIKDRPAYVRLTSSTFTHRKVIDCVS
jgi:hexosaminidase